MCIHEISPLWTALLGFLTAALGMYAAKLQVDLARLQLRHQAGGKGRRRRPRQKKKPA